MRFASCAVQNQFSSLTLWSVSQGDRLQVKLCMFAKYNLEIQDILNCGSGSAVMKLLVALVVLAGTASLVAAQYPYEDCHWDCEIEYCDYYGDHCDYDCYEVCYPYRHMRQQFLKDMKKFNHGYMPFLVSPAKMEKSLTPVMKVRVSTGARGADKSSQPQRLTMKRIASASIMSTLEPSRQQQQQPALGEAVKG